MIKTDGRLTQSRIRNDFCTHTVGMLSSRPLLIYLSSAWQPGFEDTIDKQRKLITVINANAAITLLEQRPEKNFRL